MVRGTGEDTRSTGQKTGARPKHLFWRWKRQKEGLPSAGGEVRSGGNHKFDATNTVSYYEPPGRSGTGGEKRSKKSG